MESIDEYVWYQEGPGVRKNQYTTFGVKLLNVANLVEGNIDLSTSSRYISVEEANGKYNHFLVDEGDLIIASSGVQVSYFDKKMGFAKKEHLPLCMNTSTIRFKALNDKITDIKYFMYFLKSDIFKKQLQKLITGSAQLNFGPSHLKKIKINMPILQEQENVVRELDKVQQIIDTRKKQIEELDELINSQFVEMFGDLKQNNKGWKYVDTIGNVCLLNPKKSELSNYSNIEVSFVPMQAISEKGDIDTSNIKLLEDVKLGFTYFKENDILFAKITPCMENGKGAVAKGLRNNIGFGSTEFHVIRPKEKINSIWLYTLTTLQSFRKEAEMKMSGSAGQKRVPIKFFEDYKIGIPPIELQNQFADIVRQINKQKIKLQDNLEEMKQLQGSLMNKYF